MAGSGHFFKKNFKLCPVKQIVFNVGPLTSVTRFGGNLGWSGIDHFFSPLMGCDKY